MMLINQDSTAGFQMEQPCWLMLVGATNTPGQEALPCYHCKQPHLPRRYPIWPSSSRAVQLAGYPFRPYSLSSFLANQKMSRSQCSLSSGERGAEISWGGRQPGRSLLALRNGGPQTITQYLEWDRAGRLFLLGGPLCL